MSFWWISQGTNIEAEHRDGFIFASLVDRSGRTPHHWKSLADVEPGDLLFSYFDRKIGALGIAKSEPYLSTIPGRDSAPQVKEEAGRRVDVHFQVIEEPIRLESVRRSLLPLLTSKYAPLDRHGKGVQGYLFHLPPRAGKFLLEVVGHAHFERQLIYAFESETERDVLVSSRVGQGRFRADLLRYWQGECAVTGITDLPLLRASHIKPWSMANNHQRLDVFNGLLLSPSYDAAFDAGLITFNENGRISISKRLELETAKAIGIVPEARISLITDRHAEYLRFHSDHVFE